MVEIGEGGEGPIELGVRREGGGIGGEETEDILQGGVDEAGTVDGALEEEAEMGGVVAVVEVGGDEAGEMVGRSDLEGLIDGLVVGVKDLIKEMRRRWRRDWGLVKLVPDFSVGRGLEGYVVLSGEINYCCSSRSRSRG